MSFGYFKKRIWMPRNITEKFDAKLKDGVLTIIATKKDNGELPKTEIQIK